MPEPSPRVCPSGHPAASPEDRFCGLCGQPFLGAQAAGPSCPQHPGILATTTCPRCGSFACPGCMQRLFDGSELCTRCFERDSAVLPWDRRHEVGTLRAWWRTSWQIATRPTYSFSVAAPAGSTGSSLWFAVLANVVAAASTLALYALIFGGMFTALAISGEANKSGLPGWAMVGITAAVVVTILLLTVLTAVVGTLLNAGLDHLVLRIIGAKPKSFEVTLRASALSLAPAFVGLVPGCGVYGFMGWALVLRVFAYRGMHRISGGQAAAGALIVPGLGLLLFMVGYAALIALTAMIPQGAS